MRTDSLFYRLFQDWPGLVLELAGVDPAIPGYQLQAIEIKQTSFRHDGVLIPPPDQPDAPLVFIETQFQYDPEFHARWFAELFLYLYRHPSPREWRAVTLFLDRKTEQGPNYPHGQPQPGYQWFLEHAWVKRIYLRDAIQNPNPSWGLRLLSLLLAPPTRAVNLAKQLLTEPPVKMAGMPDEVVLASWIETVLVYKLPNVSREELRAMLELVDVDLKQTRFYREVFAEGCQEGHQNGFQQGIQKGIQDGLQQGIQKGIQDGSQAERRRIAKSLLDLIPDDRLLAERTGLTELEIRQLRGN